MTYQPKCSVCKTPGNFPISNVDMQATCDHCDSNKVLARQRQAEISARLAKQAEDENKRLDEARRAEQARRDKQ